MEPQTTSRFKIWQIIFWLVLIGAIIFASYPLLNGYVLATHDLNYFPWLNSFDQAIRSGWFFPKWLPDAWYGYGAPVFHFYPPLFYYLAEIPHLLGLGLIASVKIALIAGLLASFFFAYLWLKELVSKQAALLGALAFTLAPYHLGLAYIRGANAEFLALAFIPLALWAIHKFFRSRRKFYLAVLILALAATILTHFITAGILVGLLIVYASYLSFTEFRREVRNVVPLLVLALLIALGITAFFWFPALVDLGKINAGYAFSGKFDFHENFLKFYELVTASFVKRKYFLGFGILHWVALILGIGLIAWRQKWKQLENRIKYWIIFGVAVTVVALCLTIPASTFIWEIIPSMKLVQFPWRFLGLAAVGGSLLFAVLIGLVFKTYRDSVFKISITAALLLPFFYVFLPPILVNYWEGMTAATDLSTYGIIEKIIQETADKESARATLDQTILPSEYLPAIIGYKEKATKDKIIYGIADKIENNQNPRIPKVELLSGQTQITDLSEKYLNYRYLISSEAESSLGVNIFQFPGWQAKLDGKEIELLPDNQNGTYQLEVPAGEHELTIFFSETSTVKRSRLVSFIILIVGLGLLLVPWGKRVAR